jgi:hypothetical protein
MQTQGGDAPACGTLAVPKPIAPISWSRKRSLDAIVGRRARKSRPCTMNTCIRRRSVIERLACRQSHGPSSADPPCLCAQVPRQYARRRPRTHPELWVLEWSTETQRRAPRVWSVPSLQHLLHDFKTARAAQSRPDEIVSVLPARRAAGADLSAWAPPSSDEAGAGTRENRARLAAWQKAMRPRGHALRQWRNEDENSRPLGKRRRVGDEWAVFTRNLHPSRRVVPSTWLLSLCRLTNLLLLRYPPSARQCGHRHLDPEHDPSHQCPRAQQIPSHLRYPVPTRGEYCT